MVRLIIVMLWGVTSTLHGIQLNTMENQWLHSNLLSNQRVHVMHAQELKGNTKPYSAIPRLQPYLQQQRIVKIEQTYGDIPVFGSRIVELHFGHCKGCKVLTIGRDAQLTEIVTHPFVAIDYSFQVAEDKMNKKFSKGKLVIYPTETESYLTWMVDEDSPLGGMRVFVDAQQGEIVDYYDRLFYVKQVAGSGLGVLENEQNFFSTLDNDLFWLLSSTPPVQTYQYDIMDRKLPGRSITSANGIFEVPSAVDAQSYAQLFYQFLKERFGRHSYDNQGAPIISTVDFYNIISPQSSGCNAIWHPTYKQVIYGKGHEKCSLPLPGAMDVVVHEITQRYYTSYKWLSLSFRIGERSMRHFPILWPPM